MFYYPFRNFLQSNRRKGLFNFGVFSYRPRFAFLEHVIEAGQHFYLISGLIPRPFGSDRLQNKIR